MLNIKSLEEGALHMKNFNKCNISYQELIENGINTIITEFDIHVILIFIVNQNVPPQNKPQILYW